jgi:uncharacterized membrane protein YebE (DUF533 family)
MEATSDARYDHGMGNVELTKRRKQLRNLIVMAFADGSLGEREVNLVADRCSELGLDGYDLQKAVEFGLGDDAALEIPVEPNECRALLQDLIRMMAADGHLDESEKRLFALAAAKMMMSVADVEKLIDETLEH